ncbi:MAG: 1-acyl-sn-glycerol-3-phosphate acyltransferase [Bacteroides sp.]|nr:1-acyl-sn-glycerol-3-phosphate acyltransferase [Bacteroides sp.]
MKKAICSFIYYKLLGWKTVVTIPDYDKAILCVAPHTSNWDFFIGKLVYGALGRKSGFLMKKEWFFFPLGNILRAMEGIPVNRTRNTSMINQIAETAKKSKTFHLAVTPEGTRSANPKWKTGFYYMALKAGIPIELFGIDFATKTVVGTKTIFPSGDIEKDMREIKLYFSQFQGKFPQNFTLGEL